MPANTTRSRERLFPNIRKPYVIEEEPEWVTVSELENKAIAMAWTRANEDRWALIGPVVCTRTTVRALLVKFEEAESWVPKSMLHQSENEIAKQGDQGMLVIPEWLAKEKGWL